MIILGDKVKDSLTGFKGVVIAKTEYLNGCISYQVQDPKNVDKAYWIDEQRLTVNYANK